MGRIILKDKISLLNAFLTVLIVIVHSNTPIRFGELNNWDYPFIYITTIFCRIATPSFYFISALLFYKGCEFSDIRRKLKTRIKTLFIPYLLWNTLFVLIFYLLTHITISANLLNLKDVLNNPKDIIIAILDSRHSDLWFIRNLMFYIICSPIILYILKHRFLTFVTILSATIYVFCINLNHKDIIHWIPTYLMGAFVGYNFRDNQNSIITFLESRNGKYILFFCFVISFILTLINPEFDIHFRIISPLFVWFNSDKILNSFLKRFSISSWMHYTFFIYCSHHFVLNVIQKLIILSCPKNTFVMNFTFLMTPIVTITLLSIIAKQIKNHYIYKLFCGKR